MKRTAVDSSCLASVGYLPETETLEIEFRSGAVYQYFQVPPEVHRLLLASESKGAIYVRLIKTHYSTKRTNPGALSIAQRS